MASSRPMYANEEAAPSQKSSSVYAAPDPTQRVVYSKRRVQSRADTEEGGEHVYESLDVVRSSEDVPEPQEDLSGEQGESELKLTLH